MGIKMDKPLTEMSLTDLIQCCIYEMDKYRNKGASNDRYCLEIFRRAVLLRNDEAWTFLLHQFNENMRVWLNRHPSRDVALRLDSEQSYIDEAFRRFWQSVNEQQLTFTTIASAFSYLHLCLNCAIMDALRAFSRPREEPISEYGQLDKEELFIEDFYEESELWEVIEGLLPGREKRELLICISTATLSHAKLSVTVLVNSVTRTKFIV